MPSLCNRFIDENHLPLLFFGVLAGSCLVGAAGNLPAFKVEPWVNSGPLTAAGLRGKVVLVDFWECTHQLIRNRPMSRRGTAIRRPRPVVIGVHAPEFEFGKRAENIDRGIRDHGLTYSIAIDNDFATWRALRQRRLASEYLFDAEGKARQALGRRGPLRRTRVRDPEGSWQLRTAPAPPAVSREAAVFAEDWRAFSGWESLTRHTVGAHRREPGTPTYWRLTGEAKRVESSEKAQARLCFPSQPAK